MSDVVDYLLSHGYSGVERTYNQIKKAYNDIVNLYTRIKRIDSIDDLVRALEEISKFDWLPKRYRDDVKQASDVVRRAYEEYRDFTETHGKEIEKVSETVTKHARINKEVVKKIMEDAGVSVFSSILSFLRTLIRNLVGTSLSIYNLVSAIITYVADRYSSMMMAAAYEFFNFTLRKVMPKISPKMYIKGALLRSLSPVLHAMQIMFPAVFPMHGKMEFLRTGPWNVVLQWKWAGYNIFELVTIAKNWKCWPVKVATERLKKKLEKKQKEVKSEMYCLAKDIQKVVSYWKYKGYKNSAYNVGYMLSRLIEDDEIREFIRGSEEGPQYGLLVSSYGCNMISDNHPPVRFLRKIIVGTSRFFEFYKDEYGRIWVSKDAYGTVGSPVSDEIERLPNIVVLSKRTWIDDGVYSVIKLATCKPKFTTIRLKARCKRLLNDIKTILYDVMWSRNLRMKGVDVTQVPATQVHLDCLDRHLSFFEKL